jgi:hypothetical protein
MCNDFLEVQYVNLKIRKYLTMDVAVVAPHLNNNSRGLVGAREAESLFGALSDVQL